MRDVTAELKALKLYGMASSYAELLEAGDSAGLQSSRWLIQHLLAAESTERHLRSIRYQLSAARFPVHRDLRGFDFTHGKVDERLINELANLAFTEKAHNVVFIGGPGTAC